LTKFKTYTEGLEQARINRVLDEEKVSNISTVQDPSRPWQSNPRRRPMKLLLAMLFGAIGSVALAFVSESMDHSLKRPEEVPSRLGLQALAVLPLVDGSRLAPFARGIQTTAWDTPEWAVQPLDMLYDRIGRAFAPALASSVLLGVTACRRDEGVTGVASTLALALTRRRPGERVLYVDANARGEPGRRVFGLRKAGAVELVMEDGGRITAAERSLEAEPPQAGEGEEAKPALYERWMPLIREQDYRYVVFDLPPVSEERAALQLCGSVDGVLVVVEAERLRREIIRRSFDLLRESKANILGVVFNKRRFHVPEWLYQRL
jgi:polysaccharide biosynthesis transport protein